MLLLWSSPSLAFPSGQKVSMSQFGSSPCVVVVEDNIDSRSALSRLLTLSGYEVRSAGTVGEALAVVETHGCDLLIADVGLPDGSGLELMKQLRAVYGLRRGIALSGYTSDDDMKACTDAGFRRFMPKPVAYTELLAEVQGLLQEGCD